MPDRRLRNSLRKLLHSIGRTGPFSLSPIGGGGNNRAFRVSTAEGPLFLKEYFDARRLDAEVRFVRSAWARGVHSIAEPLAHDRGAKIALFSFLPGRSARPGDIGPSAVDAALRFFFSVNGGKPGSSLSRAAEACFSLQEHLDCVDRRVDRLSSIRGRGAAAKAARRFVTDALIPAWTRVRGAVGSRAAAAGIPLAKKLPAAERRLSPSDFGFHNARIDKRGRLHFFDFEYAGWDDPAKMVNDFFCQPRVPVPRRFRERFVNAIARRLPDPTAFRRRAAWLAPVYEVKWCCIMLNDFLPIGRLRRRFAGGHAGEPARLAAQLRKARLALRRLNAREARS